MGDGSTGSLGASDVSGYMVQVSLTSGEAISGMQEGLALNLNTVNKETGSITSTTEYIGRADGKPPTKFSFSLPKLFLIFFFSVKDNCISPTDLKFLNQLIFPIKLFKFYFCACCF